MQNQNQHFLGWKKLSIVFFLTVFCFLSARVDAQIQSVTTVQHLNFGAFTQGSNGGTITLANDGSRSATGSVIPLNIGIPAHPALFEVEAAQGTIISILNGPDIMLTGSNGGRMRLQINVSDPVSPFISSVAPPGRTQITIGGTLQVGDAATSLPGNYTGSFYITFNNE